MRSEARRGLRRLAEETGGGYFELEKTADLAPTFTRVAQELHSQYVLGFTPAVLDGKVHRADGARQAARHDRARAPQLPRGRGSQVIVTVFQQHELVIPGHPG